MPKIFIPTLDFLAAADIAETDLFVLSDVSDTKTVRITVEGIASALGITSQGLFSTSSNSILARLAQLESDVATLYATKSNVGHGHPHSH